MHLDSQGTPIFVSIECEKSLFWFLIVVVWSTRPYMDVSWELCHGFKTRNKDLGAMKEMT